MTSNCICERMKLFFFLLVVVVFNGSFMFPRVNSVRIHLDNRMDSHVTYNVQQYGAKEDGTTDNIKVRET